MSDPRERDNELNPQPIPPRDPPHDPPREERKGVSPLIWIVLLLVLAALGWWFYNQSIQRGIDTTAPGVATEPAIGSEQDTAAQAERERAAANEARRAERERQAAAAPPAPAAIPADRELAPIARVEPDYPPAAFRAREEGTVLLRVDVDSEGSPTNVSVVRRSGSRELDQAAQEAVLKWKFSPAIQGGKAVASSAEIPVDFSLTRQ